MVIDDVFAVIAEATRRDILVALQLGDRAVGELVEELGISQPTVSKHLKVLRESGLVSMRAQGQKRYYALRLEPLGAVTAWLDGFWPAVGPLSHGALPANNALPANAAEGALADVTKEESRPAAEILQIDVAQSEQLTDDTMPQQIGRSVGRAAGKAADLFANLPKLRRRKD